MLPAGGGRFGGSRMNTINTYIIHAIIDQQRSVYKSELEYSTNNTIKLRKMYTLVIVILIIVTVAVDINKLKERNRRSNLRTGWRLDMGRWWGELAEVQHWRWGTEIATRVKLL